MGVRYLYASSPNVVAYRDTSGAAPRRTCLEPPVPNATSSSNDAAEFDARALTQRLAKYRDPSQARSILEIAVTAVPLVGVWVLMWAAVHFRLVWLCLLLSLPAAGFLVRLFMIQHDCGHGAFFGERAANDWIGESSACSR